MAISLKPQNFLTIRVHHQNNPVGLTGLCAGYEDRKWRADQLAAHLLEWLPEFALNYSERESLHANNAVALISQAANTIYTTEKYGKRGEIGELLLHVAIRQVFNTIPAISKYYYKDASNDTVKGFDAVHVIYSDDSLQLWLGEVKFYSEISQAVSDVVKELSSHTKRDYLRGEFLAITNKIDDAWPYAEKLKKLIHKNTSLDEVFNAICIPVFLSYESVAITSHDEVSEEFKKALAEEVIKNYEIFCSKDLPQELTIHLFLFPMKDKKELTDAFNERLKAWQTAFK